jgi:hypothetical protein
MASQSNHNGSEAQRQKLKRPSSNDDDTSRGASRPKMDGRGRARNRNAVGMEHGKDVLDWHTLIVGCLYVAAKFKGGSHGQHTKARIETEDDDMYKVQGC